MPWDKKDVESFNKGLSERQKDVWVRVANAVLAEGNDIGDKDCEALAIKQANSAAERLDASRFLNFKAGEIEDYTLLSLEVVDKEKGIEVLSSGDDSVEYFFNKSAPYNWTEENLKDWAGKKFGSIQFAAGSGVEYFPDEKLPPEVINYRDKLKSSNGGEPFIRRLVLKAGKFEISGGKKVHFSNEFYDKWGPAFARKPIFKGHKGHGSTDDRERIGIILAYQNVEGEPYCWIYLNNESVISTIREYEALGIEAEEDMPYGQFSLEMYTTEVKTDEDGYMEPVKLYRKGLSLALVGVAGATGTMIEKIAAMQQTEEDTKMSGTKIKELLLTDASVEDITKHEKFGEAFKAFAEGMADKPLDEANPLSVILSAVSVKNTEGFNELIGKVGEGAIKMLSASDLRLKLLEGVTEAEVPWLAGFAGAVDALEAEKIKGLPKFNEAVMALSKEEITELPAVKEIMAAKGEKGEALEAAAILVGKVLKGAGATLGDGQNLLIGDSGGTADGGKKLEEVKGIAESIVSFESLQAKSPEDFKALEPFVDGLIKAGYVKNPTPE